MTKRSLLYFLLLLLITVTIFPACKTSKSDIGAILFKETRNKVFKKVDTTKYNQAFRDVLADLKPMLRSPKVLQSYYSSNEYEPYFVVNLVPEKKLLELLEYYQRSPTHGLSPDLFDFNKLKPLVDKLYDKEIIKTEEEAYQTIAQVEILTANSLIKYSNALQFGTVNPRFTFARYYMDTERPDSVSMSKVFQIKDLNAYLDSIQPANPTYKRLQEALAQGYQHQGMTKEETAKIIKLNLERLRWKNKSNADRYVWVNIPDFSLTYFENGNPSLKMKVCVGEAKESGDNSNRSHNHETPLLNSEIHTIVVNPVWNIPKSIAQNEIAVRASEDRYYLSNNGIEVYHKGQKIDPDNIDWAAVSRENMKLDFKQVPGESNALGKMKFLFKNGSSVYLHDTPAKSAFKLSNRAISHGCVRVEDPLALAKAVIKSNTVYKNLLEDYKGTVTDSKPYNIEDRVTIYLDYITCWVDEKDAIQIRPDVYYLDSILYRRMAKYLS